MFTHPELARQIIRDRERQMLAEASQRRLCYQLRHPATAGRPDNTMRTLIISLTAAAAIAAGAATAVPALAQPVPAHAAAIILHPTGGCRGPSCLTQ